MRATFSTEIHFRRESARNKKSMTRRRVVRFIATVVGLVHFLTNCVLANISEASLWQQRRDAQSRVLAPAIRSTPVRPLLLPTAPFAKRVASAVAAFASVQQEWTSPRADAASVILIQDIHGLEE